MPAPLTRHGPRGSQFIRQWKLLVRLRQGPQTLEQLAGAVGCSRRTVRRDLEVLVAAGLPIGNKPGEFSGDPVAGLWYLLALEEWPRREATPIMELQR